ncbi:GNAT family N-acetyltransferase [Larkinella soli]|uniref:GNAT family N-acetyltransferase n=1 Tax=Larkinella soli TaxID=1770527 RepID=UPI000FFB9D2C|nr:GNAT family N-acetyltransferase [Larkinella soli]
MNAVKENVLWLAVEQAGVACWREFWLTAGRLPELQPAIHTRALPGGGLAGRFAGPDILAFNRCLGLGLQRAVGEAALDAVETFFAEGGIPRFFVPVFPGTQSDAFSTLLESRGYLRYNQWAMLYRHAEWPLPEAETHLTIRIAGAADQDTYARIVNTAFDWPEAVGYSFAASLGRAGWRHYLALNGEEAVAVAALYQCHDVGVMALGATLPGHRNLGAQTALIRQRIRDARALGCRHLCVETAENRPEAPSKSYQNLIRQHFIPAYLRPNYLYHTNR